MKIVLMITALAVLVAGCALQAQVPAEDVPEGTPVAKELRRVEIRDYEGERLDSVGSFRENSIKGVQYVDISNYTLKVDGLVSNELGLTYDEVVSHDIYSKVVTLHCVEGWSRKILWEGVLIEDLLAEANVNESANTIIFHAYDGYTSSLPLDYIIENDIILAHRQNNVTLPAENGFPFQVVAEDKYGIKWVKWVVRIEVSDNPEYKGFWEERGYNNQADVGGPVFE